MNSFRGKTFRLLFIALPVLAATVLLWSCKQEEEASQSEDKVWKLNMIKYEELRQTKDAEEGFREGLKESGLIEGEDYVLVSRNGEGDNKTVLSHIDISKTDGTDILISLQTSTLHSVVKRGEGIPVVFMVVANPFVISSVGNDDESHLPYITGVYTNTTFDDMMEYIKACLPNASSIGTLYSFSELDGRYYRGQLKDAAARVNLELKELGVTYKSSVPGSTQDLIDMGVDAICQIEDNLTTSAFPSLMKVARDNKIPVFSFVNEQAEIGSVIVYAPDYRLSAKKAARMTARIIRGDIPGDIPFDRVEKFDRIVNLKAAADLGITIPQYIIDQADIVIGKDD